MEDTSNTQFDFTYAPGTSMEQIIGFEMAGEIWSSYLNDNVSVNIYVESTDQLPEEVVGAALPGKKEKEKYDKVWKQMSDDITSSNDRLAFDNLPSSDKEFSVIIDGVELDKTKEFRLTNANAKSLNLLDGDRDKLDGYILVNDFTGNSTVGWDYDALRDGDIQNNEIDFLSVAMHEIGHVLGFTSGIDDEGWLEVLTESREEGKEIKDKDFKFANPLDLYRYSEATGADGKLDLSTGGNPYFSINGGSTNLGNFANGEYADFGGDGYQASHWQQDSSQGIMNPVLPVGERRDISNLDLTAMDVIGWDLNTGELPSWEEMYDNAVANAETSVTEDRSKDVEKMIKESNSYDGRRSRSSSVNYSFQIGYWQYTTLEEVDAPDEFVEEDLQTDTEADTVTDLQDSQSTIEDDYSGSEVTGLSDSDLEEDSLLSGS